MYKIRSDDARSLWDFHSPTLLLLLYPTNADEAAASAHPEASTRRGRKKSETMTTTRSDDESRMKWKLTEWPKFLLKLSSSSSYPRFAISFCVFWNEFVIHSSSLTLSHHSWSVVFGCLCQTICQLLRVLCVFLRAFMEINMNCNHT